MNQRNTYTIMEAAKLSGLPESTLRYYETIGIIPPIARDPSSTHRVYTERDLNIITSIACLNATGMSVDDMKSYIENTKHGEESAEEQINLLLSQEKNLEEEEKYIKIRQEYVKTKISYWTAVRDKDRSKAEVAMDKAVGLAKKLKALKNNKW